MAVDSARDLTKLTSSLFGSYSSDVAQVTNSLVAAFQNREKTVEKDLRNTSNQAKRGLPCGIPASMPKHMAVADSALSSLAEIKAQLVAGLKKRDEIVAARATRLTTETETVRADAASFSADVEKELNDIETKFTGNSERLQVLYAPPRRSASRVPIPTGGVIAPSGEGGPGSTPSPLPEEEPEHVSDEVEKLLALVRTSKSQI